MSRGHEGEQAAAAQSQECTDDEQRRYQEWKERNVVNLDAARRRLRGETILRLVGNETTL